MGPPVQGEGGDGQQGVTGSQVKLEDRSVCDINKKKTLVPCIVFHLFRRVVGGWMADGQNMVLILVGN